MKLDLSPLKEAITALGQALDFSHDPLMTKLSQPQKIPFRPVLSRRLNSPMSWHGNS